MSPTGSFLGRALWLSLLCGSAFLLVGASGPPSTWPGPNEDDQQAESDSPGEDDAPTLGQPIKPAEEDPSLRPPAGPPRGNAIRPIGLAPAAPHGALSVAPSPHYFNYNGNPVVLVGVSADNACHFNVTGTGQCSYGSYTTYINDMANQGLNVLRLWVSTVGGNANATTCQGVAASANDSPFLYDGSQIVADGLGRWKLDQPNTDFFNRLYNVIAYAQSKNIIVEVTLFSPLTVHLGAGPWGQRHAYLSNGTKLAGFSDTQNFTDINSAEYKAMKTYVFNVLHWTEDKLWSFPNLFYEIANEPENVQPTEVLSCGWGTVSQSDPATVAAWQKSLADELINYEQVNYVQTGKLQVRHFVGFEPSTTTAADTFVGTGVNATSGTMINSHYVRINPKKETAPDISTIGLGAIKMIRKYYIEPKIFGFNETKITGASGCVTPNTAESVDAGRAEAWEFMLDAGGVYNQFGYNCVAADYAETRRQMGVLRRFLSNSPVTVYLGAKTTNSTSPSWVNPGAYELTEGPYTFKYWAALEPAGTWASQRWLLYVHHSHRLNVVSDGYVAMATSGGYQERLSVCLGSAGGTYKVRWFDPRNATDSVGNLTPVRTDTLVWPGTASCTPGGSGSIALQPSPLYNYDMLLLVSP